MIEKNDNFKKSNIGINVFESLLYLLINTIVLLMASNLFKGFEISTFWYAVLAAFLITILNKTIKPILVFFTLPITLLSLGIFYPFINVIILKITGLIIGSGFEVKGIFVPLFISFFISFMNMLLNVIIVKPLVGKR